MMYIIYLDKECGRYDGIAFYLTAAFLWRVELSFSILRTPPSETAYNIRAEEEGWEAVYSPYRGRRI
jgi:hypothetical protein